MKIVLRIDRHPFGDQVDVLATVELHDEAGIRVLADKCPLVGDGAELAMHIGDASCQMEGIGIGAEQAVMR